MRQTPYRDWQVSGERTSTSSTPACVDGDGKRLVDLLVALDDGRVLLLGLGRDDRSRREATDDAAAERVGLGARELLRLARG